MPVVFYFGFTITQCLVPPTQGAVPATTGRARRAGALSAAQSRPRGGGEVSVGDQNQGISLKLSDKTWPQSMEQASPSEEKVLEVSWNTHTSNWGAFGQRLLSRETSGSMGGEGGTGPCRRAHTQAPSGQADAPEPGLRG